MGVLFQRPRMICMHYSVDDRSAFGSCCAWPIKAGYSRVTAVLLASGTAALEAVLTGRPAVAAYQMNPWTYWMVKGQLHTKFITLPNFLANQALIPEFIQGDASVHSIVDAMTPMLKEGPTAQFLN